jgi:hypothetical protein
MGRRAHVDHTACNLGRLSAAFFVGQCQRHSRHAERLEACMPGAPFPTGELTSHVTENSAKLTLGKRAGTIQSAVFSRLKGEASSTTSPLANMGAKREKALHRRQTIRARAGSM